jgi:excisionase family DNA binding protein
VASTEVSSETRPGLCGWQYSCDYLGIGRTKYFELIKSGELAAVRIGRRVLTPHAELDAFIERLRTSA